LEQGCKLTAEKLAQAERGRGLLTQRAAAFFDDFDLLITPATIVAPFDVNIRAVNRCNDYEFENYFDWYTIAYAITATSLPALSLPCGFTADGLPVGLQVIGPPRGEASLLSAAQSIEDLFNIAKQVPIDPRSQAN
jgi:amidase